MAAPSTYISATAPSRAQVVTGAVLQRVFEGFRAGLPPAVPRAYLEDFWRRHYPAFYRVLEPRIAAQLERGAAQVMPPPSNIVRPEPAPWGTLPEYWGVRERTHANLRAMELLSSRPLEQLTDEDRRILSQYSGWGGLSIERNAERFPPGVPAPDTRGLIHEYYTPSFITNEVARLLAPLLPELARSRGYIRALEPSAGIGRFLRAFLSRTDLPPVAWTAVEMSELAGMLLKAVYPQVKTFVMTFERFRGAIPSDARWDLVVANPPYGPRGAMQVEDPDRFYRVSQAYLYFLLRGTELVAPNGISVWLVPSGFMTAAKFTRWREWVLKSQHLMTAYRLPSESTEKNDLVFPGANLVTDLIFFRARGGRLVEVPPPDRFIVEGRFFKEFPELLLGQEHVEGEENEDHSKRPYRRYTVIGNLKSLPALEERPMAQGLFEQPAKAATRAGTGVVRQDSELAGLPEDLESAVEIGRRVDQYLTGLQGSDAVKASLAHAELVRDLDAWKASFGNPQRSAGLQALAGRRVVGAQRLLGAFDRDGNLVESIAREPEVRAVYQGERDLVSQATWLYKQQGKLTVDELLRAYAAHTGEQLRPGQAVERLRDAGFCLDGPLFDEIVPEAVYYSGHLWPKVERCSNQGDSPIAQAQLTRLLEAVKPVIFEDMVDTLSPRDSWIPTEVIQAWWSEKFELSRLRWDIPPMVRHEGMLTFEGWKYKDIIEGEKGFSQHISNESTWFIAHANHHLGGFRPPKRKTVINGEEVEVPVDEVRQEYADAWKKQFIEWLRKHPEHQAALVTVYNQTMRGYVTPVYTDEPLQIARWAVGGPKLHGYQNASARRLIANRRGLLAFDVGLGKTYTGIAVMALARQEGWARRPVIIVPNTIVWKWKRDIKRCLPDYRVLVIGSKHKVISRGERKSRLVSEVDTPEERAQKWSAFQAGRADVVLLTYSALSRTQIDRGVLTEYVESVSALQRRIQLTVTRQKKKGEAADAEEQEIRESRSEREEAASQERTEGWLAKMLETNAKWEYDPGIEWHALGIDFLMVDEAQNFKNLFGPEQREGGVPAAMGGQVSSKRPWHLDFRCASTRKHSGGAGVFLLSATPAKNGPLEFYNALSLIDPLIWEQAGIHDPEAFIDHFCAFTNSLTQDTQGKLVYRKTCTGFQNLDDLRNVLFRYADFKTAEDVGLPIPDAEVIPHVVELNARQQHVIRQIWEEIREIREQLKKTGKDERGAQIREILRLKIMGLTMRVDLIAIHPDLIAFQDDADGKTWLQELLGEKKEGEEDGSEEGSSEEGSSAARGGAPATDKNSGRVKKRKLRTRTREEIEAINPHSAKIDAVVEEILATDSEVCPRTDPRWCLNCGHVVFVENIAVHYWLKNALIEANVPKERIAILNATEAKDPETRQQVAERFNGLGKPGDDDYVEPEFDIVIANGVAYEGIDLQRRTCAIHHLDLPWDPATLQQRNGRGVRQGNEFPEVKIHMYYGQPSCDGRRVSAIANKRLWLTSLLKGHDRSTNNPATIKVNVFDLLMDIVPAEERAQLLREREIEAQQMETERVRRVRMGANRLVAQLNARMREAEELQLTAPAAARQNAAAASLLISDLRGVNDQDWPWFSEVKHAMTGSVWVPELGPPLRAGMFLRLNGTNRVLEVGRAGTELDGTPILGLRATDDVFWRKWSVSEVDALASRLTADDINLQGQALGRERLRTSVQHILLHEGYQNLRWHLAPPGWVNRYWSHVEDLVLNALPDSARFSAVWAPFVVRGALTLGTPDSIRAVRSQGPLIPPSDEGWKQLLALAPASAHKFSELDLCARYWWGRRFPRGYLTRMRGTQPAEGEAAEENLRRYRRGGGGAEAPVLPPLRRGNRLEVRNVVRDTWQR